MSKEIRFASKERYEFECPKRYDSHLKWDTKSYLFGDMNSYVWGTKSYLRHTTSQLRDTNSYLQGDTTSYLWHTNSHLLGHMNSYLWDTNSYVRDTNSYVRDANSHLQENMKSYLVRYDLVCPFTVEKHILSYGWISEKIRDDALASYSRCESRYKRGVPTIGLFNSSVPWKYQFFLNFSGMAQWNWIKFSG
jgi:hypothetical protein